MILSQSSEVLDLISDPNNLNVIELYLGAVNVRTEAKNTSSVSNTQVLSNTSSVSACEQYISAHS